jgi:serine/threonine protein kinase
MSQRSIFMAVLEIEDPARRSAYLDQACAGNPALRLEIEQLLQAHEQPGEFMDRAAPDLVATMDEPIRETVGTVIGPYKLLEQIGEGGMGTVWMAQQTEPVKRVVALKLIKAGLDSKQIIARFEAERQALALMDHPNIAKVLDAGTTAPNPPTPFPRREGGEDGSPSPLRGGGWGEGFGRPYFVMDLVKGVPITKYCDEHHLTPRQRLELFIPVCQAVQHAHQKGIIHRDLKPSNVLVALYDGKPVPKVIDFGVAKAAGQSLTDKTLVTGFGAIVGTLEHMSPEQAETNQLDIDTRSDIYSLGVLLYELLAGSPPFSRKDLKTAGMLEMLRVIREQEPSKPSTKLSTADGLPTLAANRGTEPAKLTKLVRGELDWIVMKALEKDRNRRYETANGFALDVQRYLADEPVAAGPPSVAYRFRKFARRNRRALEATLAFAMLLVVGTAVSIWQAVRATQAAEAERQAKQTAEIRLTQIEKGIALLGSIFKDLDPQAEEKEGKPLRALLGERLDQATRELEGEAIGEPLAVARLQGTLGESQLGLGYADKAITLFTKARATFTAKLGPDHPDTLESMGNLASSYAAAGEFDRALPLKEETLRLRKAKLGPDHPDTLTGMQNLASGYLSSGKTDLAVTLYEEALKLRKVKLGLDHPDTLHSMSNLALGYHRAGKLDLALPLYEQTYKLRKAKLGPDHADTLSSMNSLGTGYQDAQKLDLALPLLEETLKLRKARFGPDHPETLVSMHTLAACYDDAGKLSLAVPLFEETLKLSKAKLGPNHPYTLYTMNDLALAYKHAGKLDLALPLYEETLRLRKAKLGPDHPETLTSMNNLAEGYRAAGKLDLALPLLEEALELMKSKLGPDHPNTLTSMSNLAGLYGRMKRLDRAIPLFEEVLPMRKRKLGEDDPDTLLTMGWLGVNYLDAGRLTEAIPLMEKAYRNGQKYPSLAGFGRHLVSAYIQAGKTAEATALLREEVARARARLKPDSPQLDAFLAESGSQFLTLNAFAETESLLRESLAIRVKHIPNDWTMFSIKSMLGGALLGQKKYADAEPLLLEGYQGMKEREVNIPARDKPLLTKALERLVQLYEGLDKKDEVARWRKILEETKAAKPAENPKDK